MPKISVILTSFNHDKYIREAIDSVLKQTFVDFELIIWDDASVDDSWEIIQSYNDPRIRTFQNPQNKGPVFGINKAIFDVAHGQYIAIHHSDDVWELNKLEKQINFLDANQNIGAVFSNAQPIDQRGVLLTDETHHYYSIFSQPNRSRYEWLRHFFFKGNALCHPSILIRKQCYSDCGAYRDILAQLPDFDMWIRLCTKYEIHVIKERLINFRILDGEMNTSGNRPITRIRSANEYYNLLQQYRIISKKDNIFKIFPDFISYNRGEDTDTEYVLSRVCLETENSFLMPFARQLLAIEILFDILNSATRKENIEKVYGFSSNDLISLTGQFDPFSRQEFSGQIDNLNQTLKEQGKTIHAMENSLSWRITRPFRSVFGSASPFGIVGRRAAKLIWWTITLQLPTKLREWRLSKGIETKQPHFALPTDDYCLTVPFSYPIEKPTIAPNVAVVCHMYYPELLEEFKSYLLNIPFSFDLFITTDSENKKNTIANGLLDWHKGAVEIRIAPNQGRDIAPKLISCRDVYDRYEFFLHIHSKKSPHEGVLVGWRTYLLETLLGSERIVESIFEAFLNDPKLGMIAPQHFTPIQKAIGWGWNFDAAQKFSNQLGVKLSLNGKIDFPSGSMFWGRSAALKPLLDLQLAVEDFPPESSQTDATLAHVIERLYFFVCEQAGYRWVKIICPSLLRTISVDSKDSLVDFIKNSQYGLLNSNKEKASELPELKKTTQSQTKEVLEIWRAVHAKSDLQEIEFSQFCEELNKHISNQESQIDFDEIFYLAAHPDVAEEVAKGSVSCGYIHYCLTGQYENRIHSDLQLKRKLSINPRYPRGFLAPAAVRKPLHSQISLSQLPQSPQPIILILFSHLQEDLFFAGYSEFFKDYEPVFDLFDRVVIAVEHSEFDRGIATRYLKRIEVIHVSDINSLSHKPDIIIGFNAHLACAAYKILPDNPERVVYYCQDFESGFFPYGDDYIIGEKAIALSRNIIVSTELLKQFLMNSGLIKDQRVFVTQPKIEPFTVPFAKTKRLFFYYRPESFHKRNLPEALMQTAQEFCDKYTGFEIYMLGSVATSYSFKMNGTQIYVVNKLPKQEYIELISSCDVVVSMIYSAHPGVIAFQAAASGIPTVTNIFENRDALLLKKISNNIVPYNPVQNNLLSAIEEALAMPKGQPSFNEELYSGNQQESLVDFHKNILIGVQ